ncbi:MAG: hypothetical protein Q9223_001068 [Gallowayella weberi]
MTDFQAARFEVVVANRSSPMYDEPDASNDDEPFTQQKYIEAVAEATFEVKVTLDPNFDFAGCDAVRVKVGLDGDKGYYMDIQATADAFEVRLGTMRRWCPESGQWQRGSYSFGKLDIKEVSDSRVSREQISSLGSIRISYRRIYFGQTREARTEAQYSTYKRVSEVSEKMLKGKSIQYSMKPIAFVKTHPPLPSVDGIPLPGDLGREVVVNVLYRSKSTLQMLGCIPRSPSPQPVLGSQNGRATTAADTNVKEELRTLRARLAELENRGGTTPLSNIKSEQHRSASSVKREREDAEDAVERKRNKISGPVETIDLTGD